jgi:hypothetical protein
VSAIAGLKSPRLHITISKKLINIIAVFFIADKIK